MSRVLTRANLVVAQHVSDKSLGCALDNVLIEPDGTTVATNGKVLLAVSGRPENAGTNKEESDELVPASLMLQAKAKVPRRNSDQHFVNCNIDKKGKTTLSVVGAGAEFTSEKAVEGSFPKWREAVSLNREGAHKVVIYPQQLSTLLKAVEEASTKDVGVVLELIPDQAIILRAKNTVTNQTIVGAIMPLTVSDTRWKLEEYNGWESRMIPKGRRPKPIKRLK